MHSTQRHQPVQSAVPTVLFRWLQLNKVPLWRHVVPREDGLEENLANMSPEGAAELRSQYAMARCALDEGQWETALSSLLCCRGILKGEEARVGKVSYGLLLLWAEIPLAQMCQLRGSVEGSVQMLQKAVETWSEILEGIMPVLMNPASELDSKLLSFLHTAQYECGCVKRDSEMKAQAMQTYASLMDFNREDDAEPELCLLLSYDYYWSGSFEDSLKWIQKANRLWKQILPPASYLRWEVYVLMKLQRFKEARSALDKLSFVPVPPNEVENRAEEVRRWKQDCDMQMHKNSTSDGDLQELNVDDEELLELKYALEYSLTLEQSTQHGNIEAATPVKQIMDEMLTPDSPLVRSWLSVEHLECAYFHVSKLPEGPRVAIAMDLERSSDAVHEKQFGLAIFQLNCCREILRTTKKCIENEAYYPILASVDHLLADLYQFCEKDFMFQFEKALEVRKELLNCIQHVAPSENYMEQLYKSLVVLTEYQGCPPEDVSREQIVQKYASLMGMKKEHAECDMCFWLFFRDNCLERKLRRLRDEVMPRWEQSGNNRSSSYPHLIRCEVELLLDIVKFLMGNGGEEYDLEKVEMLLEQAKSILNGLNQRFEGQSSYEAWVHSMLEECYLKLCKCATDAGDHAGADGYQEMADIESALHLSLVQKLDLHKVRKPSSIAVSNRTQLIQVEEHIMEQYYWFRFPSAHYLAFQKLIDIGRYAQDEGDWDCAIFNLELCRDILKELKNWFKNAEFDSSLAWVDVPLVQLYQMKMKNLKKSIDLRNEVRDCLGSLEVVDPYVQLTVHVNFHAAIYLFGHSNYPSMMDEIMDEIMKLVPKAEFDGGVDKYMDEIRQLVPKVMADGSLDKIKSDIMNMDEFKQLLPKLRADGAGKRREFWEFFIHAMGRNYWEYHIVTMLLYWHFVQGDYETALDIIGVLNHVVKKYFPEDKEKRFENVCFEVHCLMELNMFEDAHLVLTQASKLFKQWLSTISGLQEMCRNGISGVHATVFEGGSRNVVLYCLRILGASANFCAKHQGAAYCYSECIKIIEEAKNDPSNKERINQTSNIVTEYRGQPGWYDHFELGISLGKIFETKMRDNRESLWRHPHSSSVELKEGPSIQDEHFSAALLNFQQTIKLLVNPAFIARANHEILKLYATMDESYFGYLLIKYGLKDAHDVHFNHGIVDMNNVKLEDENHRKVEYNLTSTEQSILEEVEANMIMYSRRTSLQFANSLYAMKGKYTESWINTLERHKDVYAKLQKHYLNKMFLEASTMQDYSQAVDEYRWKAFLYAERQRSRVLLYQLGPHKLTSLVAHQLWEFDTDDFHAMDTIQDHVAALEKDSVFVEYNHLHNHVWIIYVVQGGKLSHYLLTMKKSASNRMEKAIANIYKLITKQTSNDAKLDKDLEYLHDLLIKPIASHLRHMKLQHKLILAPTGLLTKVPFAALRDRSRTSDKEKYLVQRHTICLVPSLRAFKKCNERLEALQKLDPHVGQGAIIALGDPAYGFVKGRKSPKHLPGTKDEVGDITRQFSNIPVVTLLRENATAENLLHWVENPLHKSSRQVIVHIGAHGNVDEDDERNSHLALAPSTSTGASTSDGKSRTMDDEEHDDFGGKSRMTHVLDMVDGENDEVGTVNDELVKKLRGMVDQAIGEVKGQENSKEKEKGKGKVDDGKENDGTQEKDKGKGKEEECIEPVEAKKKTVVEWAEGYYKEEFSYDIFLEYSKLKPKKNFDIDQPKKLPAHVCSILALKDISDSKIPWRAELVVLSACHTSEGKATAEGLLNLARAFIIAGVPCVAASQWAVLDNYSPVLMKAFYYNLRHGHDVASSLRSAMSDMIDAGHIVRAWAPFVIWGSSSLVLPKYLHCEGCESMMDGWSRLPNVLVQQVLSLSAVPDVCRFRSVCKRWNSLICMPVFGTLCAQNADGDARFIIGRCFNKRFDARTLIAGWCIFDLNGRRWYRWKRALVKTFAKDHPLATDGGFVLCCSALNGYNRATPGSEMTISNPIANTRNILPFPPSRVCFDPSRCTGRVILVVDSISHTYKIFLINYSPRNLHEQVYLDINSGFDDPSVCVFESTTNQWRSSSTYPPVRQLEFCWLHSHSVIFQGLLYVLSPTLRQHTVGYTFGTQDSDTKYWLFSYNFQEDSWKNIGVDFPGNWSGSVRRELVVSGNRLFVASGEDLVVEVCDGFVRMKDPLSVTEISLADRTLYTVSQLAEPLFDAQGLQVDGGSFEFNQAFGFGDSIMLTYKWLGFSIVYNLVIRLWELWPTDPNVQLYGNVMPLRPPSASLSSQSHPRLQLYCESSSVVEAQQIVESTMDEWSRLPDMLVQQVLSLFAVPDLCRFRTVCKRWNSLICMPEFGTLCAQNADGDARFIIGRCYYDGFTSFGEIAGWCIFDLNERRWYTWMGVVNTFVNDHPLATDGGLVLCCSSTSADSTAASEITISDRIAKTREVLPLPPFQFYWLKDRHLSHSICGGANLVVDSISNTYKILLLSPSPSKFEDPVLCVFESTTNQWRSSRTYPPVRRVEGGFAYQTHSVIFQGKLYVLSPCVRGYTSGYTFGPRDYPIKYWLFSYNFLEDSWENTGVDFPNWSGNIRIELVVSGNRLFVVCGENLALEANYGSIRMRNPLTVTEILLADRTLYTVSHWAEPLFDAQGLEVEISRLMPFAERFRHFSFNQAFGFSNSIMFTYDWLGFSIVYNLVTCLWDLFPTDPNVQLYGNVMPLRLPRGQPSVSQ